MIEHTISAFEVPKFVKTIYKGLVSTRGFTGEFSQPEAISLFETKFKNLLCEQNLQYTLSDTDVFEYAQELQDRILVAIGNSILAENGMKGPEEAS